MTIEVKCHCGKIYRLDDSKAGKTLRCKECGALLTVPEIEDEFAEDELDDEFAEDAEDDMPRAPSRRSSSAGRSTTQRPQSSSGGSTVLYWVLGILGGMFLMFLLSCGGCLFYANQKAQEFKKEMEDPNSEFGKAMQDLKKEMEAEQKRQEAREKGLPVPGDPNDPAKFDPSKPANGVKDGADRSKLPLPAEKP